MGNVAIPQQNVFIIVTLDDDAFNLGDATTLARIDGVEQALDFMIRRCPL